MYSNKELIEYQVKSQFLSYFGPGSPASIEKKFVIFWTGEVEYIAETKVKWSSDNKTFVSLITPSLSQVGYGDITPKTWFGKKIFSLPSLQSN